MSERVVKVIRGTLALIKKHRLTWVERRLLYNMLEKELLKKSKIDSEVND